MYKPFKSIYNLIAISDSGSQLFGRNCHNIKEAKSAVLGSNYLLKIKFVKFKSKVYTMNELLNCDNK